MKFSLKTLAAAVVLAAAATGANATINDGGNGNGDLFLNLSSAAGSYTRDLGFTVDSFAAAVAAPGGLNLSWVADPLLTSWLGQQSGLVEMNVFGLDASGARKFVTTYTDPKPATAKANSSIHSAQTQVQVFLASVNQSLLAADSATFAAGTAGYAGQTKASFTGTFNDTVFNYLNFNTTKSMTVGNQLDLLMINAGSTATSTLSTYTRQMDGANAVKVYFTADNTLHIAAVPEPESYAMLLAGLGMVGFMARRRNNRV